MAQVIMIAGPMTGLPDFNKDAFDKIVQKYRETAPFVDEVITPWEINKDHSQWNECLCNTVTKIIELHRAHKGNFKIVFLNGFMESRGCKIELTIALGLGIRCETQGGGLVKLGTVKVEKMPIITDPIQHQWEDEHF